MYKYGVFSGPYFPVFSPIAGKYGPEKAPYLDTFIAVQEKLTTFNYLVIIPQTEFSSKTLCPSESRVVHFLLFCLRPSKQLVEGKIGNPCFEQYDIII